MELDLPVFCIFMVRVLISATAQSSQSTLQTIQLYNQYGNYSQPYPHYGQQNVVSNGKLNMLHSSSEFFFSKRNHHPSRFTLPYDHPQNWKKQQWDKKTKWQTARVTDIILKSWQKLDIQKKQGCDGLGNLLSDLGIVSYSLGVVATSLGVVNISLGAFALFTALTAKFATYFVNTVNEIITFVANTGTLNWIVGNIFGILGFIVTTWGYFGLPFGIVSLLGNITAEVLSIIGVVFGTLANFPELFRELVNDRVFQQITGPNIQNFIRTYRC